MSLFENLFQAKSGASDKLFSSSNAFINKPAPSSAHTEAALDAAIEKLAGDKAVAKRKSPDSASKSDSNKQKKSKGQKGQPEQRQGSTDAAGVQQADQHQQGSKRRKARCAEPAGGDARAQAGSEKVEGAAASGASAKSGGKHARKQTSKSGVVKALRKEAEGGADAAAAGAAEGGSGAEAAAPAGKAARKRGKGERDSRGGKQSAGETAGAASDKETAGDAGSDSDAGADSDDDAAVMHGAGEAAGESSEEQLKRTVYVGNVPAATKAAKLRAFFSECGKVESVRLRNVPIDLDSKMPKVHQIRAGKIDSARSSATAYVRFADPAAAAAALRLNMTLLDGHHVRVDRAAAPSKAAGGGVQYDPKRSVFVGNLPFNVQQEDIIAVFNAGDLEPQLEDSVEAVRVVKDAKTNVGKGIAYVLFKNRTAAMAALNLNKAECKGREMRVTRVKASAGGVNAVKVAGSAGKGGKGAGKKGSAAPQGAAKRLADFQGVRTKGKGKLASSKALAPAAGVLKKSAAMSAKRVGKRPAVAARKAQQLAAAGKLTAAEAKAALGKKKARAIKK